MIESGSYLMYDGRCPKCTLLAERVIAASGGRLKMADLRAPEYRRVLDEVMPRRRFEPSLLTLDHGSAQVTTGFSMRLRLLRVLGLPRAVRITVIARRFGIPVIGTGPLSDRSQYISATDLSEVNRDTRVRRRPGLRWDISLERDVLTLKSRTKKMQLPGHVYDEIDYILKSKRKEFTASAIPGDLDEPGRVVLVQALLRAGFLVLATVPTPMA